MSIDSSPKGGSETVTLVVGSTGTQGGAVARELLAHGHLIRLLVRDPETQAARRWAKTNAEVMRGDLDDPSSLANAMRGVSAVFSVQVGDPTGGDGEQRQAKALVSASVQAGVKHFIHSSVAGIEQDPSPNAPPSLVKYWAKKLEIEEYVRNAGFSTWTILRPAWVMENLLGQTAKFMFPRLPFGELVTVLRPETKLDMVCAADIAGFARLALENPSKFHSKIVDLAGDSATMGQLANSLTGLTGEKVVSVSLPIADALERGLHPSVVASQEYRNRVGFQISIDKLKLYGIPLTTWDQWAAQNRDYFFAQ